MMEDVILSIRFVNGKAKITEDKFLDFWDFTFSIDINSYKDNLYWHVRPLKIWSEEKRLAVEIVGCGFGEHIIDKKQLDFVKKLKAVEYINFKHIPTEVILLSKTGPRSRTFKGYYSVNNSNSEKRLEQKNKEEDLSKRRKHLEEESDRREAKHWERQAKEIEEKRRKAREKFLKDLDERKQQEKERLEYLKNRTIEVEHILKTSELNFFDGGVSFNFKLEDVDEVIIVRLLNNYIKKEYSAIRPYFNKVIGADELHVKGRIKLVDGRVDEINMNCTELDRIGGGFSGQVKVWILSEVEKEQYTEGSLTSDIIIDRKTGGSKNLELFKGDKDFFDSLINERNTKHFKHLSYLSGIHLFKVMKIRYVFNPFGFLFLIKSESNYFIVWESLDEEDATWMWRVEDDLTKLKLQLEKVEKIISLVKTEGRNGYINKSEPDFYRVFHVYQEGGFERWKNDFEKKVND